LYCPYRRMDTWRTAGAVKCRRVALHDSTNDSLQGSEVILGFLTDPLPGWVLNTARTGNASLLNHMIHNEHTYSKWKFTAGIKTFSKKSRDSVKILGARRVTSGKYNTEGPHIRALGATAQKLVSVGTSRPGLLHSWLTVIAECKVQSNSVNVIKGTECFVLL
jgi:hypothetical protein